MKFTSADGRAYTNFFPNCQMNRNIQESFNLTNTYDYRMFLQRNANKLMNQDREFAFRKNLLTCSCVSCVKLANLQN